MSKSPLLTKIRRVTTEAIQKILNYFNKMRTPSPEWYEETSPEWYDEGDIITFIRDINLEILLGNLDVTPNVNRLDKKTIEDCRKLSEKGMIIGGSVLLKACGFLDRKSDDIDVFYDVTKAIKNNMINKENIINDSTDYDGNLIRYKVRDPDFGALDIFQLTDESEGDEYLVDGIRFKDPIKTLQIKLSYYRHKDVKDYWYIKEKLGI
jgi:hypothetical protein